MIRKLKLLIQLADDNKFDKKELEKLMILLNRFNELKYDSQRIKYELLKCEYSEDFINFIIESPAEDNKEVISTQNLVDQSSENEIILDESNDFEENILDDPNDFKWRYPMSKLQSNFDIGSA